MDVLHMLVDCKSYLAILAFLQESIARSSLCNLYDLARSKNNDHRIACHDCHVSRPKCKSKILTQYGAPRPGAIHTYLIHR